METNEIKENTTETRNLVTVDQLSSTFSSYDKHRKLNKIGKADGLATLDADGKLTVSQIPFNVERLISSFKDEADAGTLKSGDYIYTSDSFQDEKGETWTVSALSFDETTTKTEKTAFSNIRNGAFFYYYADLCTMCGGKVYTIPNNIWVHKAGDYVSHLKISSERQYGISSTETVKNVLDEKVMYDAPVKVVFVKEDEYAIIPNAEVLSVNGETGRVVLSSENIPFGNLSSDKLQMNDKDKSTLGDLRSITTNLAQHKISMLGDAVTDDGILNIKNDEKNAVVQYAVGKAELEVRKVIAGGNRDNKCVVLTSSGQVTGLYAPKNPEWNGVGADASDTYIELDDGSATVSAYMNDAAESKAENKYLGDDGSVIATRQYVDTNYVKVEYVNDIPSDIRGNVLYILK